MALKSILSIILFVLTYLVLVGLAVALTFLCGFAGIMLIAFKPMFITLVIGAGLVSMGLLVLIFLFKFIFKKDKIDRSNLIEINRKQDPKLFELIHEIVAEVHTNFPRKIYLSSEVNASVFYASGFWSMFLPIRKNLVIGVGLANSVSVSEFKAILAHEFGHFSQRSMKVGSYVYNVNKIIYNLLFENDSYNELVNRWANIHGYLTIFVLFAFKIVTGIKEILKKVYEIVNINYMSLSREMEFHADEIAANVAGSKPLVSSLLRLSLADHSYNTVLNYYEQKIKESVKTKNLFEQQLFVMNFIAGKSNLPIENNLPQVSSDQLSRFNKSKLIITDQWASHPGTDERIAKLEKLNIETEYPVSLSAASLFYDFEAYQNQLTELLFASVKFNEPPAFLSNEAFSIEFSADYIENSFDKAYNCYYDNKNPPVPDELEIPAYGKIEISKLPELFSNESVDRVYTAVSLENDLEAVKQIATGKYGIKSFDYDGVKYQHAGCNVLINKIEEELRQIKDLIRSNDIAIYNYFLQKAKSCGKEVGLTSKYLYFIEIDKEFDHKNVVCTQMAQATAFIYQKTPHDAILNNLEKLSDLETGFKKEIDLILNSELNKPFITNEMKDNFDKYLSRKWIYFAIPNYYNDILDILMKSISDFQIVIAKTYFNAKKELLDYQLSLSQE